MSISFLILIIIEQLFLAFLLYFYSFEMSFFPWFNFFADRWGPIIILLALLIIQPFTSIPILKTSWLQKESNLKLKKYHFCFVILIWFSLLSFILYDSIFSKFGYLMLVSIFCSKIYFIYDFLVHYFDHLKKN